MHNISYNKIGKVRRLHLKCDGTRWRTGGKVNGKLANGVGSRYPSHYLGTWCIQHYYRWWRKPRLPVVDWTDAPADLNGLVRSAKRRNLFSARVPSHFDRPLQRNILLLRYPNNPVTYLAKTTIFGVLMSPTTITRILVSKLSARF